MVSTLDPDKLPEHVAVIMDGNGRWAKQRGMNRVRGHQQGAEAVRRIVRATREIGIPYLTLYAFSEENWRRPKHEIQALMKLLERFLDQELPEMLENGIRLQCIGRIGKLPDRTQGKLRETMNRTAANRDLRLTLALSYGGRQEIIDAVRTLARSVLQGGLKVEEISEESFADFLYTAAMPDPDLVIRTSGEYRISNFLLWQIAYSEIYTTETLWPDFDKDRYVEALRAYQQRERRFGTAQ